MKHHESASLEEKITLFSTEADVGATLKEEQQRVAEMATQLGLKSEQLSALQAVMKWAVLLRNSTPTSEKEKLRSYLDVMGYLPKDRRIVANAEKSKDRIEECVPVLLDHFARNEISPGDFLEADTSTLRNQFEDLTRSQIELLKSILEHQCNLDQADLKDLIAQFPFPITRVNFFGRFIAGGCDDPRKAIRYLRICTPYFVRLRSLLEGLGNDRYRFLVLRGIESTVDYVSTESPDDSDPDADALQHLLNQDTEPVGLSKEAVDMVTACIDYAHDFVEDRAPFQCIKVPELPGFGTDHIDTPERTQLAAEVIDWLIAGNKDGELLQRKSLSVEYEKDYKKTKKDLQELRKVRNKHRRNAPEDQDNKKAMSIWEREDDKIEREIEDLEKKIKRADQDRRKRKTILKQLEEAEASRSSIRRFREEIAQALEQERKIVFTLLGKTDGHSLCRYIDRAFNTTKDRNREGVKVLREASFLLSPFAKDQIQHNRVRGFESITEQQIREFHFATGELGASLKFILERILPEKIDPKVGMLIDALQAQVELPGITERKHFTYLVKAWSGKRKPKPEDYLAYTFEHATTFNEANLQAILHVLRELGIAELPPRCRELSAERFNHAPAILKQFQIYSESYKPNKLGQLPAVFTDIATLDAYRSLHLDAYGMAEEVRLLERHLMERGIVCIVDTTNFHPELGTISQEEKSKDDI